MKKYVIAYTVMLFSVFMTDLGAAEKGKTTLDNLLAAYNGESNAKAKYEAFAVKAEEEGYLSVAALFKAGARSEEIHANKHAAEIKKLGAKPVADIKAPEVKTTAENLEAAIKGETYETDSMYPEFLKQAEADKNSGAAMSFRGALATETEHAKLYKQALAELDSWKAAGKEFLVCQICGFISTDPALRKCPVCAAPRSKFDVIK